MNFNIDNIICEYRKYNAPKTNRYYECMKILNNDNISQMEPKLAIKFILNYNKISKNEINSIKKILIFEKDRILSRARQNRDTPTCSPKKKGGLCV